MNLLLFQDEDFNDDGTAAVEGRRFTHLAEIIGLEEGRSYKAGRLGGRIGTAKLLSANSSRAVFEFTPESNPPSPLPVTLLVALPRPLSLGKTLHCAVTMGVKRIAFFSSAKVEKSYWQSPKISETALMGDVLLALEQCRDTIPPRITFHRDFRRFLAEELDVIATGNRLYGDASGRPCTGAGGPVTLAVGPEGGFTDAERVSLESHGFEPVSLGSRILRVEFATAALLSRLSAPVTE
ncbi:MAG: 16S rRNA (uracil(1498)-N(3))-methyltransferase [Victivallaceae bacterium]|nr:16S rRNA (uracil(1498)-N(3))-methyltransferase [Victivallaceae bacterium]